MKVKVKNSANFGKISNSFTQTVSGGNLLNKSANALNTDNPDNTEGNEQDGTGNIDPGVFLKGNTKNAWKMVPSSKKENYIKQAQKEVVQFKSQKKLVANNKRLQAAIKKGNVLKSATNNNTKLATSAANNTSKLATSAANQTTKLAANAAAKQTAKVAADSVATTAKYSNPYTAATDTAKKGADIFKNSLGASQQIEAAGQANKIYDDQGAFITVDGGLTANFVDGSKKTLFSFFTKLLSVKALGVAGLFILPIILAAIFSSLISSFVEPENGGAKIVKVALQEQSSSGDKFWTYTMGSKFVNGDVTPWCACFISWCANECGYIESGIFPKSGAVNSYIDFYRSRHLYYPKDSYTPKTADLIFFSPSHIGIVVKIDDTFIYTIEGNTSDTVAQRKYPRASSYIVGYATPQYPAEDLQGSEVVIPEGMSDGTVTCTNYTYFYPRWNSTSRQRVVADYWSAKGRKQSSGHIAMIDDYYLIACTTTFGEVGDIVVFTFNDNTTMKCIIADAKRTNNAEEGSNAYGHNGGKNVIEIEYCGSPINASDVNNHAHPEFCKPVVKGSNLGKYAAFQ